MDAKYQYIIILFVCCALGYFFLKDNPILSGIIAGGAMGGLGIGYYLFKSNKLNGTRS